MNRKNRGVQPLGRRDHRTARSRARRISRNAAISPASASSRPRARSRPRAALPGRPGGVGWPVAFGLSGSVLSVPARDLHAQLLPGRSDREMPYGLQDLRNDLQHGQVVRFGVDPAFEPVSSALYDGDRVAEAIRGEVIGKVRSAHPVSGDEEHEKNVFVTKPMSGDRIVPRGDVFVVPVDHGEVELGKAWKCPRAEADTAIRRDANAAVLPVGATTGFACCHVRAHPSVSSRHADDASRPQSS